MTTATKGDWTEISLSRYHSGQIVTPIVERRCDSPRSHGHTRYTVRLSFYDASDRTTSSVRSVGILAERFGQDSQIAPRGLSALRSFGSPAIATFCAQVTTAARALLSRCSA